MSSIKPRPGITFKSLGFKVNRIDTYRTKNVWWQRLWKPKYNTHILAMTDNAIYDVCNPQTEECGNLFNFSPPTPTRLKERSDNEG